MSKTDPGPILASPDIQTSDALSSAVVVDARSVPINRMSMVGMCDPDAPWSGYQGLVVDPASDIEGDDYTVAVYFYREVSGRLFWSRRCDGVISVEEWDGTHADADSKSKADFLFENDALKKSPRVVFFRPEELVVVPSWDIEAMVKRRFKCRFHTIFTLRKPYFQNPEAYMCTTEGCGHPASYTALFNVYGSVHVVFVCASCVPHVHGWCGDSIPNRKKHLLAPDGSTYFIDREGEKLGLVASDGKRYLVGTDGSRTLIA